jgi:hypothetical protein
VKNANERQGAVQNYWLPVDRQLTHQYHIRFYSESADGIATIFFKML